MNSTVNVHLRVPLDQARLLKKAAKLDGKKLATYVRDAAVEAARDRIQPVVLETGGDL